MRALTNLAAVPAFRHNDRGARGKSHSAQQPEPTYIDTCPRERAQRHLSELARLVGQSNPEVSTLLRRVVGPMAWALCPIDPDGARPSRLWCAAIAAGVLVISWLHYVTSYRSIELHELFQRLYYVPIVAAAVMYGARGGLIVAGVSALLFLPHVALKWHAWPVFQIDQYAEVVVFTLVAGVTGALADRLRAQRDRCRRTATELDDTCRRLEASIEDRLRAERLVTVGRLAAGIAHEIRNPLGGLLGSLEILETAIRRDDPKREFLAIARNQVERLNEVVTDFLAFAHPPTPTIRAADIGAVVNAAVRLSAPTLALRDATIDVHVTGALPAVEVDAEQVERALLNVLLDDAIVPRHASVRIDIAHCEPVVRVLFTGPSAAPHAGTGVIDLFEPFSESGGGSGLALAMSRRLVENQGGRIHSALQEGGMRVQYVIELPVHASAALSA